MNDTPIPQPARDGQRPSRGRWFQLAALGLTIVSGLAGTGLARWLRQPSSAGQVARTTVKFPNRLFADWKKPDLVVVFTGQQMGYLLPCGCSRPQYGGLERRYNFLQLIKEAGWPYAAVDVGDLVQKTGPAGLPNQQGLIKYLYSMKALKEMDYTAVSFGETEANLGLFNVLAEYALNDPKPRVVIGNLIDAETNFPEMTKPWVSVEPVKSGVTVGVTGIVGPSVAGKLNKLNRGAKEMRFERTPDALDRILAEMTAKKVDLPVLLYQGPVTRNAGKKPYTEAMACAEAYPQFPVIVTVSEEDDPPLRPIEVATKTGTKTMILSLGKKGRFLGVVGLWKTGNPNQPFDLKYERVELGEEFLTPEEKEKGHPIIELIEGYTAELKNRNYLEKYGQVRHAVQVMPVVPGLKKGDEVRYAGSDTCKRCHASAYEKWKKTPHSHAYQTLVDAKRPSNRQFDPECIVCHTVGFGFQSGFVSETKTPKLKDVGCESCHGPSYVHVQNPSDKQWHQRINPWKYLPPERKTQAMDDMCQKCHDMDNDVSWIGGGFKRKWPKIEHPTPPEEKVVD
ncbi:MAG: multiheme c-type cytochrome [Gemmataceae bacterium]